MKDFLRKNNQSLLFLDQDAINVVFNGKNGFFPSYHISLGICSLSKIQKINKVKSNFLIINIK